MAFDEDKEGAAMHRDNDIRRLPSLEAARQLALDALLFLAQDGARIASFLNASGIEPGNLRASAREDRTLAAVLDHLLANESLLLVFSAHGGHRPDDVQPALTRLQREGDLT